MGEIGNNCMTRSDQVLLEAREVGRRTLDGSRWLLEGVSVTVGAGMRLGVVGPSGSGKTLLLRALAMLDPIERGRIVWRGQPVSREAIPAYRAEVMYLHQRAAMFEETVEGALRQPFSLQAHRRRRFDHERAVKMLAELQRDASFLDKRVRDLSGGEMQMVALVRALQLDPTVLLLDEPTAALDVQATASAETLLDHWIADSTAVRAWVWVTHDAQQARRVAREQITVEGGRVASG
jgi:putative ABC transport system ATP-binding protein